MVDNTFELGLCTEMSGYSEKMAGISDVLLSTFDPAVLTDFMRGCSRPETDVSNNEQTTFEEQGNI